MMAELINQYALIMPAFILIFIRLSTMIMVMPIFSYPIIPSRVRILLAFTMSIIILPTVETPPTYINNFIEFILAVGIEIGVGLFIGFGAKVIFEALSMAGNFVARQMGIGIANVMDPTSRQQIPVISQFWVIIMISYFLAFDGHYLFIRTMVKNFSLIPLSIVEFKPVLGEAIAQSGSLAFNIALKLALPAMIFLLLIDAAIAFIARVMPQMNIFVVTLPVKIGAGLIVLITSLDIFQILFGSIYTHLSNIIAIMITGLKVA